MAGALQHHIPQFLTRGFRVPGGSKKQSQVWLYAKDEEPRLALIKDEVAVEPHFYSEQSSDGSRTLDDEITDYENKAARSIQGLRNLTPDTPCDPQISAELVAHLTIRNDHLRRTFTLGVQAIILAGRVFVLTLRAPISNARRTKEALRTRLLSLAAGNGDETIDVEETILGNRIGVHLTSYDGSDRRKVLAVVANRKSDPHIGSNARSILEERIVTKSDKCSSFAAKTPVWLALLNDYFLADDETYRQALAQISASHIFEKIILISGNGSVATLYDGTA